MKPHDNYTLGLAKEFSQIKGYKDGFLWLDDGLYWTYSSYEHPFDRKYYDIKNNILHEPKTDNDNSNK